MQKRSREDDGNSPERKRTKGPNLQRGNLVHRALESLSVSDLKAFLKHRGVSWVGCVEKMDLVARAKEASDVDELKGI